MNPLRGLRVSKRPRCDSVRLRANLQLGPMLGVSTGYRPGYRSGRVSRDDFFTIFHKLLEPSKHTIAFSALR